MVAMGVRERLGGPMVREVIEPDPVSTVPSPRQQLHALSARHQRVILRAYHLIGPVEIDLMTLSETELVALILSGVRARLGA
jgi:hypothetical protein